MHDEHKEVFPIFDANGKLSEKLSMQYFDARKALFQFVEMFNKIEFRKKDYEVFGEEAEIKARQWRNEMTNHFKKLDDYLEKHFVHCFTAFKETQKPDTKPSFWRLPLPNESKK